MPLKPKTEFEAAAEYFDPMVGEDAALIAIAFADDPGELVEYFRECSDDRSRFKRWSAISLLLGGAGFAGFMNNSSLVILSCLGGGFAALCAWMDYRRDLLRSHERATDEINLRLCYRFRHYSPPRQPRVQGHQPGPVHSPV